MPILRGSCPVSRYWRAPRPPNHNATKSSNHDNGMRFSRSIVIRGRGGNQAVRCDCSLILSVNVVKKMKRDIAEQNRHGHLRTCTSSWLSVRVSRQLIQRNLRSGTNNCATFFARFWKKSDRKNDQPLFDYLSKQSAPLMGGKAERQTWVRWVPTVPM